MYAAKKENVQLQDKRVKYGEIVRRIKANNLVFIDEWGVNLGMLRLYARALKWKRARGEKPQKLRQNISIIGTIVIMNKTGTLRGTIILNYIINRFIFSFVYSFLL